MYFGVDYYPEHWDERRWPEDLAEMKKLGFNVVRVGEFAWSRFEPDQDAFDLDWMDRFLELCGRNGLEVMLGVPARNVPAWLIAKDPSAAILTADGIRESFGSRYTVCLNNPSVRHHAMRLAGELAGRYRSNPAVTSWHLDNEYGDGSPCHCELCRERFIEWLKKRYETVEALNAAWGLVFWSLEVRDWSQVWLPARTNRFAHNPGLLLDFRRFGSWTTERFAAEQAGVVRRSSPGKAITTNLQSMTRFHTDYRGLSKCLDVVSTNFYPPESYTTADLDLVRGVGKKNFWVVEQKAGPPGFAQPGVLTPRPGETRLYTWASIAHGADAVLYFRFRPCPFGQEQLHMGIMSYDGSPNRISREIAAAGREIERMSELLAGSEVRNQAALLYSWDNRWALEHFNVHPELEYRSYFLQWHREFEQSHIGTDIVHPSEDLSKYKLVVVPLLCLMDEASILNIRQYVEGGGHVIFGPRSGIKDFNNNIVPGLIPPPLREVLGIRLEEAFALKPGRKLKIAAESGAKYLCSAWVDLLDCMGAEPLARYDEDWFKGVPAASSNRFGRGRAVYLGTAPESAFYEKELASVLAEAGLRPILEAPRALWVLARRGRAGEILFVLNPTDQAWSIPVSSLAGCRDALDGKAILDDVRIEPFGLKLLAR